MYIVAIHYTTNSQDSQVQALAQVLGKTAYEARPRLTIPAGGPAVVGVYAQQERARSVASALQREGFQVLLFSEEEADPARVHFEVRAFDLQSEHLVAESRQGQQLIVPYASVRFLLRAVSFSTGLGAQDVTTKKFSLGRAALTGGLIRSKKTTTSQQVQRIESDGLLGVYSSGRRALIFRENGLLYDSLGAAMKPSRSANFLYLVGEIKRLAAQAHYDDRCLRKAGQKQLLGPALEPETSFPICAHLLALALGQS